MNVKTVLDSTRGYSGIYGADNEETDYEEA